MKRFLARLGFIVDYAGRLLAFSFLLALLGTYAEDGKNAAMAAVLMLIAWLSSRFLRLVLAGHAVDPVSDMPLAWW